MEVFICSPGEVKQVFVLDTLSLSSVKQERLTGFGDKKRLELGVL